MVGLTMFFLGIVVIGEVLIEYWHPSPLAMRLFRSARTLGTGAILLAVGTGFLGIGSGVGFEMMNGVRTFNIQLVWEGITVVVGALLAFDLASGVLQTIVGYFMAGDKYRWQVVVQGVDGSNLYSREGSITNEKPKTDSDSNKV